MHAVPQGSWPERVRANARWGVCWLRLRRDGGYRPPEAVVVAYHRVLPSDLSLSYPVEPAMVTSAETFRRQVNWLSRTFRLVTLSDLMERLRDRDDDAPVCAVTFDDGWIDTHHVAAPVLDQHGAPATVFLATDFVGTDDCFWPERLAFHWSHLRERLPRDWRRVLERAGAPRHELWSLVNELKRWRSEEREALILAIRRQTRAPSAPPERTMMSWDDVRQLASQGWEIGAHTESHAILPGLDENCIRREVAGSKSRIEQAVGRPCRSFAYPNGNLTNAVRRIVAEAGFDHGVTCDPGLPAPGGDPLAIPRVELYENVSSTLIELRERLSATRIAQRRG